MPVKEADAQGEKVKPKRYQKNRRGYQQKGDGLEWLTQYHGGQKNDVLRSILDLGAC